MGHLVPGRHWAAVRGRRLQGLRQPDVQPDPQLAPDREGAMGKRDSAFPTFHFIHLPLISVRPRAGLLNTGPCANLQ